jgi:hypothetical protein
MPGTPGSERIRIGRRGGKSRARPKTYIKLGGKQITWQQMVKKKKSIKEAAKIWRKKPKYRGGKRVK